MALVRIRFAGAGQENLYPEISWSAQTLPDAEAQAEALRDGQFEVAVVVERQEVREYPR